MKYSRENEKNGGETGGGRQRSQESIESKEIQGSSNKLVRTELQEYAEHVLRRQDLSMSVLLPIPGIKYCRRGTKFKAHLANERNNFPFSRFCAANR